MGKPTCEACDFQNTPRCKPQHHGCRLVPHWSVERDRSAHAIKIEPRFFESVKSRSKTAELRFNDRDYRAGDVLVLQEYGLNATLSGKDYTGRELYARVTEVLEYPEALRDGWVMLSFQLMPGRGEL